MYFVTGRDLYHNRCLREEEGGGGRGGREEGRKKKSKITIDISKIPLLDKGIINKLKWDI